MKEKKRRGRSYAKRVADINEIYDTWIKTGLSNREIWKRYIWPRFGMSERTFYNLLKAPTRQDISGRAELEAGGMVFEQYLWPEEELKRPDFFKKQV